MQALTMVGVFRTNISASRQADDLRIVIRLYFPQYDVTFDLDDCDHVLRVCGDQVQKDAIIRLANTVGYEVSELVD